MDFAPSTQTVVHAPPPPGMLLAPSPPASVPAPRDDIEYHEHGFEFDPKQGQTILETTTPASKSRPWRWPSILGGFSNHRLSVGVNLRQLVLNRELPALEALQQFHWALVLPSERRPGARLLMLRGSAQRARV